VQRDPKLGKSKVPSLKLHGSDCQGICRYERTFKPNKNQASATTRNRLNGQVILFLMKLS